MDPVIRGTVVSLIVLFIGIGMMFFDETKYMGPFLIGFSVVALPNWNKKEVKSESKTK